MTQQVKKVLSLIFKKNTKKFLQVKLGRGREAQNILMQRKAKVYIDILLVREPYDKQSIIIWYENMIYLTARVVRYRMANFKEVNESNFDFIYATIEIVSIYSCYFSPNMNHEDFTRAIANRKESIRKDR